MAAYALVRFTSPNAGVSVNQAVNDQYIAAAYGLALKNMDVNALGIAIANILTSAGSIDLSAASDTAGLKLPSKAGAAPTADGFLAFDTTAHRPAWGSNGSTAHSAAYDLVNTFSANQVFGTLWSDAPAVTVASAATFALPTTGNNVNVTGTTTITDFTGPATNGVLYKLQFTNASPTGITSGNHAKLNGSFSPTQNQFIYLFWDGTNAWEMGRYTGAAASVYKELGVATATATQSITSTASPGTDVTGITLTVTPDGMHPVLVTVDLVDVDPNSTADAFIAIQVGGVVKQVSQCRPTADGPVHVVYRDAAPSGSTTYKASMWSGAAQTLSLQANNSATHISMIRAEQIQT